MNSFPNLNVKLISYLEVVVKLPTLPPQRRPPDQIGLAHFSSCGTELTIALLIQQCHSLTPDFAFVLPSGKQFNFSPLQLH